MFCNNEADECLLYFKYRQLYKWNRAIIIKKKRTQEMKLCNALDNIQKILIQIFSDYYILYVATF